MIKQNEMGVKMMMIDNYYYKLTDKPALGMIFFENGRYLHPCYCNYPAMPLSAKKAHKQYILRIESTHNVTADTDGGCDRICECVDYQPLLPNNIIMDGDKPVGVYLDLGYYGSISPERPNVIVIPFEDGAKYRHKDSGSTYMLIPYDPEKSYESSRHVR